MNERVIISAPGLTAEVFDSNSHLHSLLRNGQEKIDNLLRIRVTSDLVFINFQPSLSEL